MKWFSNLKIAYKLAFSFVSMLIMIVGLGIFALVQFAKLYKPTSNITNNYLLKIETLGEVSKDAVLLREFELGYLAANAQDIRDMYLTGALDITVKMQGEFTKYEPRVDAGEERGYFQDIQKSLKDYLQRRDRTFELVDQKNMQEATKAAFHENKQSIDMLLAACAKDVDYNRRRADQDRDLSNNIYRSSRGFVLAVVIFALILGAFMSVVATRAIVHPLRAMEAGAANLANGDTDQEATYESKDEVGAVADSFREVIAYNRSFATACEAMGRGDLTVKVTPKSDKDRLAKNFSHAVSALRETISQMANSSGSLASAAEELSTTSSQMSSNAAETAAQSDAVSSAAEQISANVQTVVNGSEELTDSIKEIAANAHEAARVAGNGVKVAESANQKVAKLGESSREIGQVIKVITTIAEQTHLLALNATIEAARAGEAGKGFAVVANEVKELAKETAKATEDISRKIEAIQTDTKGAVEVIGEISKIITKISDIQNTIASAVEEQSATTNEINRNVADVAKGNQEISRNITGVATAAKSTTAGAEYTNKAAGELAQLAAGLQNLVRQFDYGKDAQHASNSRSLASDTASLKSRATAPAFKPNGHASNDDSAHLTSIQ